MNNHCWPIDIASTHGRIGKIGYGEWRSFCGVMSKARTACEISGKAVKDHFVEVTKMVKLGSGSERQIDDLMLTRLACYLIAQNGDSSKPQIAFAQSWSNKSDDFMSNLLNASWGSIYWISWNTALQCESIQRIDFLIKDAIWRLLKQQ